MTAPKRSRLETITAGRPDFAPFLALVEITAVEAREPVWDALASDGGLRLAADRAPDAPLLDGAEVSVPPSAAQRLLSRLLAAAGRRGAARSSRLDALAVLEAAIAHDHARLDGLAAELDLGDALPPLAQLAAAPLLQACGRALAPRVPPGFAHGHCPICGAWPTMAEVRGLERRRHLRCGRCGGDWRMDELVCPFCQQDDHRRLVALVPETGGEARKVDACEACRGYVKSLATLTAWSGASVLLEDLDTVELDLAAQGRGYTRPAEPGRRAAVRVVPAPEKPRRSWGIFS